MFRTFRICSLALLLALLGVSQLIAQVGTEALIRQSTARRYGLERSWFAHASVGRSRSHLENWALDDGLLLVQSSLGAVEAINPESGRSLWTSSVGGLTVPTGRVAASESGVAVVHNTTLYLLDRQLGRVSKEFELDAPAMAGPAMTKNWIYVGLANGHMRAFSLNPNNIRQDWYYGTAGRVAEKPVTTRESVVWQNNRGLVTSSDQDTWQVEFHMETDAKLTAPLAYWPPYLYVMDANDYLYAVEMDEVSERGRVRWRYQVGGTVSQAPVPIGNYVYVVREDYGLLCLQARSTQEIKADQPRRAAGDEQESNVPAEDRDGGELVWFTPRIHGFLSVSDKRVYATDSLGRIVILDKQTGSPLGTVPTLGLDRQLVNTATDRIYVATKKGLIQCLHEIDNRKPLRHEWPPAPGEAVPGIIQQEAN